MEIILPEHSLLILCGPPASGKASFARQHFLPEDILLSHPTRKSPGEYPEISGTSPDPAQLQTSPLAKRMEAGLLTVMADSRLAAAPIKDWMELAKKYFYRVTILIFELPERFYLTGKAAPNGEFADPELMKSQIRQVHTFHKAMKQSGFKDLTILDSEEKVASIRFRRVKMSCDKREISGPFDIIGDIHGCFTELRALLEKLDYTVREGKDGKFEIEPPPGRKAIFVGDLTDRGPDSVRVVKLVMTLVKEKKALMVPGNHDFKFTRWLRGNKVSATHGLDLTIEQMSGESEAFKKETHDFLAGLSSHLLIDGGKLVVAHAGLKESMHGRSGGQVRSFCMYGDVTGKMDEYGLPVRLNWAADYSGKAVVVYGHTPQAEAIWVNNTLNIDTGCVFGGKLTALRYPEGDLVSVPALRQYCQPSRPFLPGENE